MEISGSTIGFSDPALFPLQNVPVLKLTPEDETGGLSEALARKLRWYTEGDSAQPVGISFRGVHSPSFDQVQGYASQLVAGLSHVIDQLATFAVDIILPSTTAATIPDPT